MNDYYVNNQNMLVASKAKNPFSVTIYNNDTVVHCFEYNHSEPYLRRWLMNKNTIWTHGMYYHRKTNTKLARIYPDKETQFF